MQQYIYATIFFWNTFSVGDLTAVLAATLREHKLVITRADIDHIVQVNIHCVDHRLVVLCVFSN